MSRRSKKKLTNRAKLVITVVLIAICLFVMHNFEFLTKSEEVITTNVEFIEYGTENSMKSDLELFLDENNNSYIVLPENVNGYIVKKYLIYSDNILDLENIEKQDNNTKNENIISDNTTSTNSIENTQENIAPNNELNNTNTVTNEIDKTEESIVENKVDNSGTERDDESTNEIDVDENTNTVIENSTNTVEDNKNTTENNTIVENTITNTIETNTIVENNNKTSNTENENQVKNEVLNTTVEENVENTVVENIVNPENSVDTEENKTEEKILKEYQSGERIYLTEEQLEKENLSIFAEYQTVEINGVKLYNQELISESAETKIVVTGYMPVGYSLNVKAEDVNEIEELKADVEELKDTIVLAAYDIKILNGETEYQPKDYYQIVNVAITSEEKFKDNLIGKSIEVLHINETEEEILFEKINVSNKTIDTVECLTNEFSRYAVVKEDEITPTRVLVNNYDNDYNYYMGRNFTDDFSGRDVPYTETDFAEVTINYHSYNINNTEMDPISTSTVSWTRGNQANANGNATLNMDITATFGTGQFLDTTKPWTMQFDAPVSNRFNIAATASDATNNDITITYDETTNRVTVTGSNWDSWVENNYKSYTLDIDLVYTGTGSVATFSGINTYNFVITGTEKLLKGYISTVQATATSDGERQTTMTYTHAVPISGGKVSVELIDNPYMDRPGGAGFNGWLSADADAGHVITTNQKTFVQNISANVGEDRKVTINLYADWKEANVIFVDSTNGSANNDGSINKPVNGWTAINTRLGSSYAKTTTTASNRELNIIVFKNGTLRTLQAKANQAYTLTSIYDGHDYRPNATFYVASSGTTTTTTLSQDVQMAFLKVDGPNNYNTSGLTRSTAESATQDLGSWLKANGHNFRIGRGMMPNSTAASEATFTQIQGGADSSSNDEYKLVLETGKYLNVQVMRASGFTSHKAASTAVIGNDFDRVRNNNNDLHIYTKFSSRTGSGTINELYSGVPLYTMIVKSGRIGLDCFKDTTSNKPYAGIYVGGHGSNGAHDNGDRILIVEGGLICNIVGGLASYDGDDARSFIYIKGGTIANIVGGAGRSPTYGNRAIQVTDGTVLYSVNGGSNGVESTTSDNGTLNGSTKIYIGGNAVIGAEDTLTGNTTTNAQGIATLYGTEAGCVLGAGNGNDDEDLVGIAGRVLTSHIIIDGNARINNSVYGGGNYGVVNPTPTTTNNQQVIEYVDKTSEIVSGGEYLITNGMTVGSSRAINGNSNTAVNTVNLPATTAWPSNNMRWIVTVNGNQFTFRNVGRTNRYLYNTSTTAFALTNNANNARAFTAEYVNGGVRLSFTASSRTRYVRINNGTLTTTTTVGNATIFHFLQPIAYVPPEQDAVDAVKIDVYDGTIKKNIYGGSNQSNINGTVSINTFNGTVEGAIYGGSNQKGTITQSSNININGGTIGIPDDGIDDIIFGGGLGNGTTVSGNAIINIKDINANLVLNGNIYGGSQAGTVSRNSIITVSDSTSATNSISITGNIFGGGKGAENDPATTNGDTTVIVDGGEYSGLSVFGGCNINGDIGGNVLVEIGKNNTTKVDFVYGAGNEADISPETNSVQVDIFSNATVESAFNGGNEAGIEGTNAVTPRKITVDGGTVTNLYGGSNSEGDLIDTYVYVKNNAVIGNVYGGGLGVDTHITGNTHLDINGSTITGSAYGGGSLGVVQGNTSVNVKDSNINKSLYGGGQAASVGTTDVNVENSTITNNIYGGGEEGSVIGNVNGKSTDVYIYNNSQSQNVFGGGKGQQATVANNTVVTIESSKVIGTKEEMDATTPADNGNVYGGGDQGLVSGNTSITISDLSEITNNIFGGGNQANVGGNTSISIENSNAFSIYGGGNAGEVGGTTTVTPLGSTIDKNIYGGGNQGAVIGNTYILVSDSVDDDGNHLNISEIGGSIYGGGRAANANGTYVGVQNKSRAQNVYGGGEFGEIETSTTVFIEDSTIANNVYGGGKGSDGSADATLPGQVKGNCTVEIENNSVISNRVFGAGEGITAEVGGNTIVDFKENSSTGDDIYGGGDNGPVKGNTSLFISSGNIGGNAYGAGNGVTALVSGKSYLGVDGNTTIVKSAFGGGNAAETGDKVIDATGKETGDALVIVDIAGGIIGENVYGGANSSVIYGSTVINIGVEAINDYYGAGATPKNFVRGKVDIGGTIFGGGEQMDPTKEFNYDTISVTETILINIDGEGYETSATDTNTFNFYQSVFGSGNASSANTNGDINIRNYGTREIPKRGISIQRASNVVMDATSILLNGTTDSTSAHPEGLFALNRIGHLKVKNNTTLYLVNGANLLAHYSSMVGEDGNEEYATARIVDTVVGENGTSYQVINGKIYDNNGNMQYYVANGAILEPNTSDIGEDIEVTKIASVQNATTIDKNTDNRIYMYSGRNLNISDDEEVTSKYGDVKGMTFFGIFKSSGDGEGEGSDENSVYMGMYDPSYTTGGRVEWNERDFNRSYVLGLHERNPEQDITKDGFYTVYEKMNVELDENDVLTEENYSSFNPTSYTSYITPTPKDDVYYLWYAGPDDEVFYYSFILTASKHSTFGTKELSLLGISYENAVLTLSSVDASLINEVGLYSKNDIPNINTDQNAANNNFGLTMKTSSSGWSMTGSTDVYADAITATNHTNNTSYDGTNRYVIENLKTTPAFVFFLYHSNNITEARELGTVQFNMGLSYWKDALNRGSARIIIDAILLSEVYDDTGYNGAIAPGSHYDLFANTVTNITTESSFSTYFEFAQENFSQIENIQNYYNDSYRVITTEYAFPIGTTITMIDRWDKNNPAYYYLDITAEEYGRVEFRLDEFKVMGSSNETFNEKAIRSNYLITENDLDYEYENFIFIANFENAEFPTLPEGQTAIVTDQHFRMYLKTIIDGREEILFGLLDDQIDSIVYGIYDDESTIDVKASLSKSRVFLGNDVTLNVNTVYDVKKGEQSVTIYDTRYFDKKLGVKLTFYKKNDVSGEYEVVNGANLLGTYFELNGEKYYPRADGTTRIKIAELVSNASSKIKIGTENSALATGEYQIKIESFGSADGIYYGVEASATTWVSLELINDVYGLNSVLPVEQVIIDKETGYTLDSDTGKMNEEGHNVLNFDIEYLSGLNNPYITVTLYRREYDETMNNPYQNEYTKVDLSEYVTNELSVPIEIRQEYGEEHQEFIDSLKQFENEYTSLDTQTIKAAVIDNTISVSLNADYELKENLKSGTYKVMFTLYDASDEIVYKEETNDRGESTQIPFEVTEYMYIGDTFSYIIIK